MTTFETLPIGTTVFIPRIQSTTVDLPCPDCAGSKYWHVSTAKGRSFMIDCPRCGGGKDDCSWLKPKRHEYVLKIEETTIKFIDVEHGARHGSEEVVTRIRYKTRDPYSNGIKQDEVLLTREDAEKKGAEMLDAVLTKDKTEWDKDRERDAQRAGFHIIQALETRANRQAKKAADAIEKIKSQMLEAIRSGDGPEIKKAGLYGHPEITSEALADWLGNLLNEADVVGWSEEELHEAMCHC